MTTIGNLRRARVRCHRQMKATEALLAGYIAKLAELEAAIHAIDPELPLAGRHRTPNPIFARGEFTRLMLEVLREAEGPLPMRQIGLRMLALKGHTLPDKRTREITFYRLSTTLSVFHKRGKVVMGGTPNKRVWRIA